MSDIMSPHYSFSISNPVISCFSSQFSCLSAVPTAPSPADTGDVNVNTPQAGLVPWAPGGPGPGPGLSRLLTPRRRSGPALILKLFVTESYKQERIGPCVITADHRVYVEVCVCCIFSGLVCHFAFSSPNSSKRRTSLALIFRDSKL